PWATAMERDAGRPGSGLADPAADPPGPGLAVRHSGWLAVMELQRGAGERNYPALSVYSTAIAEIHRLWSRWPRPLAWRGDACGPGLRRVPDLPSGVRYVAEGLIRAV